VSEWLWNQVGGEEVPPAITVPMRLAQGLRYGENPHQAAAFYVDDSLTEFGRGGVATSVQHHGKEMSYNNYLDADAAYSCACDFKVRRRHTSLFHCMQQTRSHLVDNSWSLLGCSLLMTAERNWRQLMLHAVMPASGPCHSTPLQTGPKSVRLWLLRPCTVSTGSLASTPHSAHHAEHPCVALHAQEPTCVIVKHTNPCGVASAGSGRDLLEAYRAAVRADPVSAFGGIVAFNVPVDADLAREIREFR
jgi:hypothetical protein